MCAAFVRKTVAACHGSMSLCACVWLWVRVRVYVLASFGVEEGRAKEHGWRAGAGWTGRGGGGRRKEAGGRRSEEGRRRRRMTQEEEDEEEEEGQEDEDEDEKGVRRWRVRRRKRIRRDAVWHICSAAAHALEWPPGVGMRLVRVGNASSAYQSHSVA